MADGVRIWRAGDGGFGSGFAGVVCGGRVWEWIEGVERRWKQRCRHSWASSAAEVKSESVPMARLEPC